jgi:hypothetical protein
LENQGRKSLEYYKQQLMDNLDGGLEDLNADRYADSKKTVLMKFQMGEELYC